MKDKNLDISLVMLAVVIVATLPSVIGSFFTVKTAEVAVVTRFGKFLRVAQPGLNWKWPFIDAVTGRVSLRAAVGHRGQSRRAGPAPSGLRFAPYRPARCGWSVAAVTATDPTAHIRGAIQLPEKRRHGYSS